MAASESTPAFRVPDELPILPLRDMVVFPYMVLPLFVGRERSISAVHEKSVSAEVGRVPPSDEVTEHRFVVAEQEDAGVLLI